MKRILGIIDMSSHTFVFAARSVGLSFLCMHAELRSWHIKPVNCLGDREKSSVCFVLHSCSVFNSVGGGHGGRWGKGFDTVIRNTTFYPISTLWPEMF